MLLIGGAIVPYRSRREPAAFAWRARGPERLRFVGAAALTAVVALISGLAASDTQRAG
jgi:hypothetical protein